MDNPIYVALSRQSGLLKELSVIAHNMANTNTTGYKKEGAIFSEYIAALSPDMPGDDVKHSLSMGRLAGHVSDFSSGTMKMTGGQLDLALEGEGFFTIQAPEGIRLSRAGHFMTNQEGIVVNADGLPLLDAGGGTIQIPFEARLIAIGGDGTISADGLELARIGIVRADPLGLQRRGDNLWEAVNGYEPAEEARLLQGFLEDSNVQPLEEIARMIEVQRMYDAGQKLLDLEHERINKVISTVRQTV